MRIHELKCFRDVLIVNYEHSIKAVLTPQGAVYDNFVTADTRNLSRAFAALFDDNWRLATGEEIREIDFYGNKKPKLNLVWNNTAKEFRRSAEHLKLVVNNG